MNLQELLDQHGLDAEGIERTLEWARGRADELVSELEEGSELRELFGSAPAPPSERRLAREDLPPVPSAAPKAVDEDDGSMDIPIDAQDELDVDMDEDGGEAGETISIDDGDIEMLDEDDLEEIVEEEEEAEEKEAEEEEEGAEPDLLALAEEAKDTGERDGDLPPERDPALDALVASLDVGDD